MKRIRYIAICGVLIIGLMGCKKEVVGSNSSCSNVLPPLTHEGKNTFGCLVNGEVWVAYAPFTVGGTIALDGSYDNGLGHIDANLSTKQKSERVRFYFKDVFSVGIYQMYLVSSTKSGMTYYTNAPNCSVYYHDTSNVGVLNVSCLDPVNRIMSGTFEMDLVNPSCPGDTIKIREGRFDWCY